MARKAAPRHFIIALTGVGEIFHPEPKLNRAKQKLVARLARQHGGQVTGGGHAIGSRNYENSVSMPAHRVEGFRAALKDQRIRSRDYGAQ